MEVANKALRHDVIQNAVNHQVQAMEDGSPSAGALETLFNSELNHDLITWPRQYLEAYLDSDESGRVPLTPEELQDVLEAAFERDEALAVEFLEATKANKEPRALPGSSLQIVDARPFDPDHPYELLFDHVHTEDLRKLSARIYALAHLRQADAERRETSRLLTGPELPPQIELVLKELGSEARIDGALNDSGIYRGTVLAETARDIIQQITPHSVVIHQKDDLDTFPRVGQHVRITYSDGVGHVTRVRERTHAKELAR